VLTERFGVSRGSIRDALRMLETIGLIETQHGRGTFPRELTVDRLVAPLASMMTFQHDLQDELLDVRRMFEPAVARAAATRATDVDFADLQRILDAQQRKLKKGQSAIVEDTAFHAALARSTRNRVVVSLMATLNDLLVESRKLTLKQKGRPAKSIEGHEAVVAALRRRDAEARREPCTITSIRSPICNRTLAIFAKTTASSWRRDPWMSACARRLRLTYPTRWPDPPRASGPRHFWRRRGLYLEPTGKRSSNRLAIAATRAWQEDCGITINQLSGAAKPIGLRGRLAKPSSCAQRRGMLPKARRRMKSSAIAGRSRASRCFTDRDRRWSGHFRVIASASSSPL